MESMEIDKCVICFNNPEDVLIHVPVNEASNIIGKCSVHLHSAINNDVFVENLLAYQNEVQFCQQCFEHTAELSELSDQLGTLQKKLLDLSITASFDILSRRNQLEHEKEENGPLGSRTTLNTKKYGEEYGYQSEENNCDFVITDTISINSENDIQIMPHLDVLLDETHNTEEFDHPIEGEENCPQNPTDKDVDYIKKPTQIPRITIPCNSMIVKGLCTTPNQSKESNGVVPERVKEKKANAGCDVQDNSASSEDHSSSSTESKLTITTTQDVAARLGLQTPIKINVFKCEDCSLVFVREEELEIHKQVHTRHKCSVCEKSYLSKWRLRAHERIHTVAKHYKCSICDQTFNQHIMFKNHKLLHKGERRYKCTHCDWAFTVPSRLRDHQRVHTGEKPYKCHYCEKTFRCTSSRSRHRHKYHVLNSLYHKTQILKRKHQVSPPPKSKMALKTTATHLQAQEMSQTENQPVCEKTTDNTIDKLNKQNKSSVEKTPYNCGLCNREFRKFWHLISHERVHSGETPFKCLFCTKAFTFEGNRNKHHRLVHGK